MVAVESLVTPGGSAVQGGVGGISCCSILPAGAQEKVHDDVPSWVAMSAVAHRPATR